MSLLSYSNPLIVECRILFIVSLMDREFFLLRAVSQQIVGYLYLKLVEDSSSMTLGFDASHTVSFLLCGIV